MKNPQKKLVKSKPPRKYRCVVYIKPEAKATLDEFTIQAEGEISGLGVVRKIAPGVLLIEKVFILHQKCTPTKSDFDKDKFGDFALECVLNNIDMTYFKLWWHSHVYMDVFWSPTDTGTIDGFANEWMLSLVVNKFGEMLCRLDSYNPVQITLDNIPVRVWVETSDEVKQLCAAEIAKKVTHGPDPVVTYAQGGYRYGYQNELQSPDGLAGPYISEEPLG